jgi:hypothetical protein
VPSHRELSSIVRWRQKGKRQVPSGDATWGLSNVVRWRHKGKCQVSYDGAKWGKVECRSVAPQEENFECCLVVTQEEVSSVLRWGQKGEMSSFVQWRRKGEKSRDFRWRHSRLIKQFLTKLSARITNTIISVYIAQHNCFMFLTIVYCAPSYMFRPIHIAIFRLLREEGFYITVRLYYVPYEILQM